MSRLLFAGLQDLFRHEADFQLMGMVESPQLLTRMTAADVGLILMAEKTLPDEPDVELSEADLTAWAPRAVYLLSAVHPQSLTDGLRLRCAGYVTLNDPIPELLRVVRHVRSGSREISSSLRSQLHWDATLNQYALTPHGLTHLLSSRQIDVMTRIARGDSVKEIARDMHLSPKSVDSHKYRIMRKLGLHDRVQVTRLAIREGLLSP